MLRKEKTRIAYTPPPKILVHPTVEELSVVFVRVSPSCEDANQYLLSAPLAEAPSFAPPRPAHSWAPPQPKVKDQPLFASPPRLFPG